MLLSRITVWTIPGLILSLFLLIIYIPHVRATVGDVCNNNCTLVGEICNSTGCCECTEEYYDSNGLDTGGTCNLKPVLDANCTAVSSVQVCKDNNAECINGKCSCKPEYYDTDGSGSNGICQLKSVLDASCTAVSGVQVCKDNNAECINGKCSCKPEYYDTDGSGSNGTCQLKVDLGKHCEQPNACKTQNAYCGTSSSNQINICVCNTNYYDDNGEDLGGQCINVTSLAVKSVIFGIITVASINISWIAPDNQSGVNFYIVEHAINESFVGGSNQNVGTQTSAVLSGLISGQRYVIKITSVNNKTASSLRFTSVIKYQTSKPAIPGALLNTTDIDASSGNIILQWANSSGAWTGYVASLFSFPSNQSFNTSTSSQTFVGVKNGTVYTFTVQAVSEYDYTSRLYSEIRTETIKTRVQVPNPPRDVVCTEITDRSIILTWKPPENPNGDIRYYIITVHMTFPNDTMYNITTPSSDGKLNISNLTAGSFYSFYVYTVNEKYQSAAEVKSCQTSSQMADPPENLTVYNLTSRSGEVAWNKPKTLIETHYGYSLQITNSSGACIKEVLWKCSDCPKAYPQLNSSYCVDTTEQNNVTSSSLYDSFSYKALNLLPDIMYSVKVSAITGLGRGLNAFGSLQTKEEVPQKPVNVTVKNIQATTADLVWNMPEPRPGNTTFTIILTGIFPAQNKPFIIYGFYNQSAVLKTLQEYWNYTVTVVANTSIGHTESDPYPFRTQMAPAGPVSNFNISKGTGDDAYVTAVVSWKLPLVLERNGPIDKFYVQQNETNNVINSTILDVRSDETYTASFPVFPERNYTFMVRAANNHFNGTEYVQEYIAPAGPPINTIEKQGIPVIPLETFSSPSQTSFQIEINDAFFMDTKNGATKMKGLICCKECKKTNSTIMNPSEINNIKTYTQAQKSNSNQYRLPVPPANLTSGETGSKTRRKRSVTVYHVGIESCANKSDSYLCNGPLTPGTSYSIIAFVCTSGDCTLSNSYGPFITLAVPDTPFPVGAVVGGIVGGVAAIILIAVILLLLRKRKNKLGKTRKRVDDDEPTDMANLSKIKKQRPINLANFAEYIADYHKDSNLKFSEEYDDLKTLSPSHPHEAADMEENRLKNRFVNILPFDHTRVKLRPIDDVSGSDYINANYLPGFSKTREYIACQGPIPATIDDHWRLIWEQNVRVIVMLTQYKEENRVKCEQYMPLDLKDPKQYGDLVVECMTYSSMNSFEYRTLKIRLGEKERTIKHFHFLSWRDYSANVQLDTMIDFIKKVRSFMQPPDVEGPMIIHCSAGVGRTGTYITIDYAIQHIDKYGPDSTIDIFNFVLKMRENRTTMVQTEQQYIFIHDCIKEYLDRFKTYENQAFNQEDENLYQNTAETMDLYQNVGFNSTQKTEL